MINSDDTNGDRVSGHKKTPTYLKAEETLAPELRPLFEQLTAEYRFAAMKHHGRPFASPMVIAELIRMGWRSPPLE